MSKEKPSIPKGTRDFGPEVTLKRNFIFGVIRRCFESRGYLPLETPSMENLSVLTGKYGEEGDQLIFKILNSGDFLSEVGPDDLTKGYKAVTRKISEKALRYDLTVPFARYVAMNFGTLQFPFRRYQIQPVWRADRPQKGRYREFYQCDADIVGSNSLLCEAELADMVHEIMSGLGLGDYTLKINNRKLLAGIADSIGASGQEGELCVAIDKLDKIGESGVLAELATRGFSPEATEKLKPLLHIAVGSNAERIAAIKAFIHPDSLNGQAGIAELEQTLQFAGYNGTTEALTRIQFDPSLARGLSYYTGAIFEVKLNNVQIGSVSGGGRYDNLTGMFGRPGLSGIGISFGVDRLYDALEELDLFPENLASPVHVLVANFGLETLETALKITADLRKAGISTEFYPDPEKLKKQFSYADGKSIPVVLIAGPDELKAGNVQLKFLKQSRQISVPVTDLLSELTNGNVR